MITLIEKFVNIIIQSHLSGLSFILFCLCFLRSGTIDIYEFSALWKYIQQWKQCFDR